MGKKRPVFEFKGLSGLLGDSSSSSTAPTTYYTPYSRHHSRHKRRHHRHKSRRRYSRRKHFAADQRHRRRKAQRRLEEDAEYLTEQARREEEQRNSRKESVLGGPVDGISAQRTSRNEEYFQRVRQQTASVGFAGAEDEYLHDPVPQHMNGSQVVYPQPPDSRGFQPAGSQNSRPRRPYSDRSRPPEHGAGENEAAREEPIVQHEEDEVGEDVDDLLGGGRGLLRKFMKSNNVLDAVNIQRPKKKRTLLATAGTILGAAALAFAGKKLWDKRKEQKKEEEEQEEDEAVEMHGASGPFDSEGIYLGPNPLNLVPPPTTFSVKVPQNEAFIVERGGRFHRKLNAGSNTLIPCMDHVAFRYSLKETSMPISWQQCFTRDNVPIRVNALLFIRVDDPVSASYEIDNAYHAVIMLVQSCIKREFNKLTVEQAYTDRYPLDHIIKDTINTASRAWGIRCTRFEIKEVELPEDLRISLENAAAADRQRREEVRAAEAQCEIMVNRAEAEMQLQMRRSQARQVDMVNEAIGEAHAISERSEAIANAMRDLAEAVSGPDGEKAMQMRIAEQYLQAYGQIASGGPNPPPGPDPRQVASTVNDAIGLLNTLGQPNTSAHNPYVIPQTNPFENAPGIQQQANSTVMDGTMVQGVPDVPTTPIHGHQQQFAPGLPQGFATPDMSQTSQHFAGSSTPAAQGGATYPQPKIGRKGTPKLKPRS
ncbi:Stomatin [Gracilaria domingensis]|nr:Stomatin [Gracilaria domingensis]